MYGELTKQALLDSDLTFGGMADWRYADRAELADEVNDEEDGDPVVVDNVVSVFDSERLATPFDVCDALSPVLEAVLNPFVTPPRPVLVVSVLAALELVTGDRNVELRDSVTPSSTRKSASIHRMVTPRSQM